MITLRQLLIQRGAIRPYSKPPKPRVLKLDDRGRSVAARHIAEYLQDPRMYAERAFYFDVEEWIG